MSIEGKVAQAISPYELAFNVGSDEGVAMDDLATAYEATEIHDPDTKELLGVLRRPLMKFRVTIVERKYSVGATIDTIPNPNYSPRDVRVSPRTPQRIRKRVAIEKSNLQTRDTVVVPIGCRVSFERPERSADEV